MYTYSRIVITVGVSIFNSANVLRPWLEGKRRLRFLSKSLNPVPLEGESDANALERLQRECASPDLPRIEDAKRVSAEYSLLNALVAEDRLGERPNVVLVHTDTLGGKAGSIILEALLKRDFSASVERQEFAMNVNDRAQLRHNLGDFMQKIASALQGYDTRVTCFAPIGGYKVMTSLGYLAGAYFGFPTLYLHEDQQIVHEIPAVPMRIPDDQLKEVAPLMRKVGGAYNLMELDREEKGLWERFSWLFERAGDIVSVNAFGLFLMQQNPRFFDVTVLVDEQVDRKYGRDGRKQILVQQIGVLADKLAAGSTESDLQHERDWRVAADNGWHLYKGASNGQQRVRVIYRYDKASHTLQIKQAWTENDYEREFETVWTRPLGDTVQWQLE